MAAKIPTTTITKISSIIVNKRKGDRVTVKVKRYENGEYKDREFEVTLGKKPKIKKNT